MQKPITLGKLRGLQQCTNPNGLIVMLALDHRQNLRKTFNPAHPEMVGDQELVNFKATLIKHLAPCASAILLDPLYSAAQSIAQSNLPGSVGLVIALEETGYSGDSNARQSNLLTGWNPRKAKWMGASAVKLLVYYNPKSSTSSLVRGLIEKVAEQCSKVDLAFFLEPLTFSIESSSGKLDAAERRQVILQTVRELSPLGADILKVEFPLNVQYNQNEKEWMAACLELNHACAIPWVLLSAAVDYETYLRQVEISCQAGSCGVAVGRAVWKEAVGLASPEQNKFLALTAKRRLRLINKTCNQNGKPWIDRFSMPDINPDWYQIYPFSE